MEAWSGPSQGQEERRTALYEVSHRLQLTQDLESNLDEESTKYSAVLFQNIKMPDICQAIARFSQG